MADKRSPLGRALILRILFLSLAMALIAIAILTFYNFQTLRQQTLRETYLILSQSSMTVKEFFNYQFSHLEGLALTRDIRSMEPEASKLLLERLLREEPEFNDIALLSNDGREIVKVSHYEYISQSSIVSHAEHEHFKEALAGKRSKGYVIFEEGRPTMRIAVPVKISPADTAGVLEARIDLRFLSDWIGQEKLEGTSSIYLVDYNGLIIAHSEPVFALGQTSATQIPSAAAALAGRKIMPYGPDSRYRNLAGKNVVAGARPLPELGWVLIVEREEKEILLRILPMPLGMIAAAFSTIAFYYLMTVAVLKRRVIEPVAALTRAMRDFEEGKESSPLHFKSQDEISELAQAFEKTAGNLSAALKEQQISQAWLKKILEHVPQGLFLIDNKGRIEYANSIAMKEMNLALQDLMGQEAKKFIEPGKLQKFEETWENMKASMAPFSLETEYLGGKGRFVPGIIYFSPIPGADGSFSGAVSLGVNLTAVKEEEKKRLREERLAALGLMASKVSHELRNPLATMSNSIYYLNQNLKDSDEKIRSHLEMLRKQVENSTHVIATILDFTRPRESTFYPVNLNQVIRQALERVSIADNIKLEVNLSPDLPTISGDDPLLMQVFINLLTNACQAMPKGGELELSTRKADDMIVGAVKDTGVGIEPKFLKNLFQPFHSSKARGLGLGLSISKDIVEKHSGRIKVESQAGQGTTFSVFLPLKKDVK